MMTAQKLDDLIDQLPKVRGTLTVDAPIARLTWFRVGGNAEVLFEPADQDDLQAFLQALHCSRWRDCRCNNQARSAFRPNFC